MTIAPTPGYPERVGANYEVKYAPSIPGNRGPLRFEEGLGTDADIPNAFTKGAMSGYASGVGGPNHNAVVWIKTAEETLGERAHAGSASWVESPTYLGEFVHGTDTDAAAQVYEQALRSGGSYYRQSPTVVND